MLCLRRTLKLPSRFNKRRLRACDTTEPKPRSRSRSSAFCNVMIGFCVDICSRRRHDGNETYLKCGAGGRLYCGADAGRPFWPQPKPRAATSIMCLPIGSEAVAAGEGTLQT